jgi:porphobilinogen synthase
MAFPAERPRRLRDHPVLRDLVAETRLSADDLVMPLFVREGQGQKRPITSMPGQFQWSVDTLVEQARDVIASGVRAVILFGIPESKDAAATSGTDPDGIIPRAIRALKTAVPDLAVITDVCLCEYTDHGHCGVPVERGGRTVIDNDRSLELLSAMALAHAAAGADMVAPSDMMDGRVGAIRRRLDAEGHGHVPIMSYAAKYASSFYGPFRDAAESPPQFGDRRGYQMDVRNSDEALREVRLDIEEGADVVMVKPALAYLDIVQRVKQTFDVPVAAYQVSGEYAMIEAAAGAGWLDRRSAVLESLVSIRRAGADLILTYFASDAATWVSE